MEGIDNASGFFASGQAFEAMFDAATEGILVCNQKGIILKANRSAHAIFGFKSEKLPGLKVESLIPSRFHNGHEKFRESFHQNPEPRRMGEGRDLVGLRRDGTEFPIEVSLSHVEIQGEKLAIAFVIDISVRKQAEIELKNSEEKLIVYATELEKRVKERTEQLAESVKNLEKINKELGRENKERIKAEKEALVALEKEKELNELKSRFVSMASHEFRTPLSTILSSASLIAKYEKSEMNDKRIKHVKRIKDNVNDLTGILNDFLSLDKLETGHVESRPEKLDLVAFVNEVMDELRTITKSSQTINATFNAKKYFIFIDKNFLKNILNNLISNAIKYSKEGDPIEITVKTNQSNATIEIRDYGIGIPEEDQPYLFRRFFRAKNSMNIQGTGLGLNLIKKYLELLGGSISFTSTVGKGSIFSVILPNDIKKYENNFTN